MTRIVNSFRRSFALALVPALFLSLSPALYAQRGGTPGRNTASVLAAFKPVVAKPSESVVRVLVEDKVEVALGTVVSPDGFIITKASALEGKIVCKFKDGKQFPARIVGVDEEHDLAMLKVDTSGLRPIEWRTAKAEVGDFVASAGIEATPVAIGVVSVAVRKPHPREMGPPVPPATSGFLGITLGDSTDGGAVIAEVAKGSAADKAGLEPGDIVLSIAGQKIANADRLVRTIQRYKVGESVALKIRRGKDEKEMKATLAKRPANMVNRGDMMNAMGSELSQRRSGFPVILQHDTIIKPKDCGGPLVDLDGKAVGINVARAGRTESYAIPAEVVVALLVDLKSGKLAPKEEPVESRIADLVSALKTLRADYEMKEIELTKLEKDFEAPKSALKMLRDKVSNLRKKIDDKQADLDKLRKDPTKK